MRKTREILRQKWTLGRSHRQVARSLGISAGVVGTTVSRAKRAGLSWDEVDSMNDESLELRLYAHRKQPQRPSRPLPNFEQLHRERRKPGVTLELLHLEYIEKYPDGYRYTQFCQYYRSWLGRRGLTMRQSHRAGEKIFVDYAGTGPVLTDPKTGDRRRIELFVGVLGASSYTYAEASLTQQSHDFIGSHTRMVEYFEGVTQAVVPDNLKSGVQRACRYEPELNRTYEEWAAHYGTSVLPTRPRKPRDKAKVEVAVQVAERWIVARLRHQTFFSLNELNASIGELLDELNRRVMRHVGRSRRELYESYDRPALRPLPERRFVHGTWKIAKVNIDYHIEIAGHYYSVPHGLVRETVEARVSATTVEIYHRQRRVASHQRATRRGQHSTEAAHMPKSHRKHMEWTPSRLVHWGASIGPSTEALVAAILTDRPHPEMGYRSCLGILRLAKSYGEARLELACQRALQVGARSYRHVSGILKHRLEHQSLTDREDTDAPVLEHENIRGPQHYN